MKFTHHGPGLGLGLGVVARSGAALALLGVLAAAPVSAETIRYSDHDPLGGMRTDFVKEVWLPEITEQSGGDIEVRDFFGASLLGSKEVLTGVGQGVANMGFVFPGHYPERLVAHTIFTLFPRGPAKFEDMAWFYHQIYDRVPVFREELAAANWEPLMLTAGLPGAFAGKNALNSLEDIEGERWRAGNKWHLKYLENIGATPVSVPWGDVYVALQTGTIDGVFTNYDGLHLMKFDEVASNLLISKELWYAVPFLHGIEKTYFDALPERHQEALRAASREAEAEFGAVYDAAFDQVRAEQEEAGYSVKEMSDADIAMWENADQLEELQAEWVREAEASGLENAAEVMEQVRAIHAEAMDRE